VLPRRYPSDLPCLCRALRSRVLTDKEAEEIRRGLAAACEGRCSSSGAASSKPTATSAERRSERSGYGHGPDPSSGPNRNLSP
jgi:hypothetical protein